MARSEQPDIREELRILATQIETVNQQLTGSGGGSDPALHNQVKQMEQKINYLYDMMKNLESEISESVKGYFTQLGNQVTKSLNTNLTQVFAQLEKLEHSGATGDSKDIKEMRHSLKELIDVYKDEVQVFKDQNEFMQRKLVEIEKKLQ